MHALEHRAGHHADVERLLFRSSLVLVLLPVVVATVRAVERGWLPVGDNAYFALRAGDVLTEHHPLLGTWTSASISAGVNFNNPGPLLFDLLAVPAKLGGGAGVAIGAALLNSSAIVGIAVVARRRGGSLLGILSMVVTAALCWSMGSELLFDPWQPHSLLLCFVLLLFLVWSLACGDVVVLPLAVGIASLIIQTHLSYAILVAALAGWGVLALVLVLWRPRSVPPARSRRTIARSTAVAVLVLALCWAQPLVEQMTSEGQGNLARLAQNATGAPDTVGPVLASRLVARVVATPSWWLRPSFEEALAPSEAVRPGIRLPDLPSAPAAAALLIVVAAVLLSCWLWARSRADRTSSTAVVTAAVGLLAGLATATSLPLGFFIAPHQLRWLWPLAAFTTFAVAACWARTTLAGQLRTALVAVATGVVFVLALLSLPTYNVGAGPADDDWAIPAARELRDQMGTLEGQGPFLIDVRGLRFAEPYSVPVMLELQRRNIPFGVDDEGMVRQLGTSRRAKPRADRLLVREGDATQHTPPGHQRAALVEGLGSEGRAELAQLRASVLDHLEDLGRVPLNERGEAALARGDLLVTADRPEVLTAQPEVLLATRELVRMIQWDHLDLDQSWRARFDRYAELQQTWDRETVAIFIAPPDPLRSES